MSSPILVFIGHAYSPRCASYSLPVFREMMQAIEDDLNKDAGGRIVFVTELTGQRGPMRPALLRVLGEARLAVVDISDNNPNVLFELGHLIARGVPVKILKSQTSLAAAYRIPIYVDAADVELYAHAADVKGAITRWLRSQVRAISAQPAWRDRPRH